MCFYHCMCCSAVCSRRDSCTCRWRRSRLDMCLVRCNRLRLRHTHPPATCTLRLAVHRRGCVPESHTGHCWERQAGNKNLVELPPRERANARLCGASYQLGYDAAPVFLVHARAPMMSGSPVRGGRKKCDRLRNAPRDSGDKETLRTPPLCPLAGLANLRPP